RERPRRDWRHARAALIRARLDGTRGTRCQCRVPARRTGSGRPCARSPRDPRAARAESTAQWPALFPNKVHRAARRCESFLWSAGPSQPARHRAHGLAAVRRRVRRSGTRPWRLPTSGALDGSRRTPARSACFVDANFGFLVAPVWNRQIEAREFRDEERCARTWRRCGVGDASETARILFLKDIDVAFAAAHI